jgi:hypothetical protein
LDSPLFTNDIDTLTFLLLSVFILVDSFFLSFYLPLPAATASRAGEEQHPPNPLPTTIADLAIPIGADFFNPIWSECPQQTSIREHWEFQP